MSFLNNSATNMNTLSGINRPNTVDFSKFTFSEPKVNENGGKSSRVKYAGQDFYIQTPRMRLPYGLGKWIDKENPNKPAKYSIDFSLAGYNKDKPEEYNPRIGEFYDFLVNLQKTMIDTGIKNSVSWFGKPSEIVKRSIDTDPDVYLRDLIKYAKDKVTKQVTDKYPPTFKARVSSWEGKFQIKAYDDNNQEVKDFETAFTKGTEAVSILKLKAVTFQGKVAGLSFDIVQIKLYRPASIPDYAFIDDENDNKPLRKTPTTLDDDNEYKRSYSNEVEDSDEETNHSVKDELDDDNEDEDDEEEDERPPTPPPQTKSKSKTTNKTPETPAPVTTKKITKK
jgi:hypothetical protein